MRTIDSATSCRAAADQRDRHGRIAEQVERRADDAEIVLAGEPHEKSRKAREYKRVPGDLREDVAARRLAVVCAPAREHRHREHVVEQHGRAEDDADQAARAGAEYGVGGGEDGEAVPAQRALEDAGEGRAVLRQRQRREGQRRDRRKRREHAENEGPRRRGVEIGLRHREKQERRIEHEIAEPVHCSERLGAHQPRGAHRPADGDEQEDGRERRKDLIHG
ncbi:MAG: hypothetical protein IV086_04030 [Hyphomonadaceae bacterium]|nr:hypothetical protein [Hyphomonadaceae bacterium]